MISCRPSFAFCQASRMSGKEMTESFPAMSAFGGHFRVLPDDENAGGINDLAAI
jgi:hypothetical protein